MINEWKEILVDCMDQHLAKIIISGPRKKDSVRKIEIRPVLLKEQLVFQASAYTEKQVQHYNLTEEEVYAKVAGWMEGFRQLEVLHPKKQVQVLVSKKGKRTVRQLKSGCPVPAAPLEHNRRKKYILDPDIPVPFLHDLGVQTKEGKIVHSRYDKFRQMNRFLEFIEDIVPELPKETPDLIYLCIPNNPSGTTLTRDQLKVWVDYANKVGAVILYDAAYEAYISEPDVPHSIFEIPGARTCAIEFRSFSKNAGFTGVRLGFTVVPKDLKSGDTMVHSLWARRHGTKFNGAPYIIQKAAMAVYSDEGKAQLKEQVGYYMRNARVIYDGLKEAGYEVYGGINAPYIWLKVPAGMTSWEFFDYLLENANVVGTPGSGFGPSGEGYFRLTAFGTYENTVEAIERMKKLKK